jgi:hypothetical protein
MHVSKPTRVGSIMLSASNFCTFHVCRQHTLKQSEAGGRAGPRGHAGIRAREQPSADRPRRVLRRREHRARRLRLPALCCDYGYRQRVRVGVCGLGLSHPSQNEAHISAGVEVGQENPGCCMCLILCTHSRALMYACCACV